MATPQPSTSAQPPASSGQIPTDFKVYRPPNIVGAAPLPALSDNYFTPTTTDLKQAHTTLSARTSALVNAPLRLKATCEAAEKSKRDRWPETTIRVKFPDQTQLEKKFPSTDKIRSIYAFVRGCLRDDVKPIKFILYQSPPKRDLRVSDLTVRDLSLVELQLAPSSILLLRFEDESLNHDKAAAPLLPSILEQSVDVPVPAPPPEAQPTPQAESSRQKASTSSTQTSSEKKIPKWSSMPSADSYPHPGGMQPPNAGSTDISSMLAGGSGTGGGPAPPTMNSMMPPQMMQSSPSSHSQSGGPSSTPGAPPGPPAPPVMTDSPSLPQPPQTNAAAGAAANMDIVFQYQKSAGPGLSPGQVMSPGNINAGNGNGDNGNGPGGEVIWKGVFKLSGSGSNGEKREVSTRVVVSSTMPGHCQSNTWPSIFQLVPTTEIAPSWEALVMWRQLYQGVICTILPWQGRRDPENYGTWEYLVRQTGMGDKYATAAWTTPTGSQTRNALFVSYQGILFGIVFPMTGIPEMPGQTFANPERVRLLRRQLQQAQHQQQQQQQQRQQNLAALQSMNFMAGGMVNPNNFMAMAGSQGQAPTPAMMMAMLRMRQQQQQQQQAAAAAQQQQQQGEMPGGMMGSHPF